MATIFFIVANIFDFVFFYYDSNNTKFSLKLDKTNSSFKSEKITHQYPTVFDGFMFGDLDKLDSKINNKTDSIIYYLYSSRFNKNPEVFEKNLMLLKDKLNPDKRTYLDFIYEKLKMYTSLDSQSIKFKSNQPLKKIQLTKLKNNNGSTIPLSIDSISFNALFDTGAFSTFIDKTFINTDDLENKVNISIRTNDASYIKIKDLKIGGIGYNNIDLMVDESTYFTNNLNGVIGWDFIRNFVLEFKYTELTINPKFDQNDYIKFKIYDFGRPFIKTNTYSGNGIWVMIDTGGETIINQNFITRSGEQINLDNTLTKHSIYGEKEMKYSDVDTLKLYQQGFMLEFYNITCLDEKPNSPSYSMILGSDILKNMNYIIDGPNGYFYIKK